MKAYYVNNGVLHGDPRCSHASDDLQAVYIKNTSNRNALCDYCGARAEEVNPKELLSINKMGFIDRLRLLFG